uniref:Uncharacterized protein n=1 Tax=Triticum urartu TaxID=4572 RepID=A0A8R7TC18_TRIUA
GHLAVLEDLVAVAVADVVDVLHDDDVDAGVPDGAAAGEEHRVVHRLVVAVGVGGHLHLLLLLALLLLLTAGLDDDQVLRVHGRAVVLPRQRDDGGLALVAGAEGGGEVVVEVGDGVAHLGGRVGAVVGSHGSGGGGGC